MNDYVIASGRAAAFWYTLWWLRVGFQRLLCPHKWHWSTCICERCGVRAEELEDHTWRWNRPEYFGLRRKEG
jgi:hypothetical protein